MTETSYNETLENTETWRFGNDEYFMSKLGPQDFDECFLDDEYFRDKTRIQKELVLKQKGRLHRRSNTGGVIV